MCSINAMISDDGELQDIVGEDQTDETDYVMDVSILVDQLSSVVSERDLTIFCKRHGIVGYPTHSLEDIAQDYDITRSRVHQVTNSVYKQMRDLVRS